MAVRAPPVDHHSSSDEAPEEESFSTSTAKVLKRVKAQKDAVRESNKVQKEKRRARDTQLKSQKRKLLSQVLEDLQTTEISESEEEELPQKTTRIVVKAGQHKKLSAEKDGFQVRVVKRQAKKLPPPKSSLLDRKERFLFRSSVPRK